MCVIRYALCVDVSSLRGIGKFVLFVVCQVLRVACCLFGVSCRVVCVVLLVVLSWVGGVVRGVMCVVSSLLFAVLVCGVCCFYLQLVGWLFVAGCWSCVGCLVLWYVYCVLFVVCRVLCVVAVGGVVC